MVRSTPHAHTDFVDGRSSAEQMVLAAIGHGFGSLGFSEHGAQPFDFEYCLNDATERMYRLEVGRLRERYAGDIAVYRGIERDLYSTAKRFDYDYVIGSVHYMPLDGAYIAVDGPVEPVGRLVARAFGGDGLRFAERYFETLAAYVESYRPDIIGHVDLIRKHNDSAAFFDVSDRKYREAAFAALERMAGVGALLEINTGAMARGALDTPYPQLALLERWNALGGRVILSTDCHDAALIGHGLDAAQALAREAGYKCAWALNPDAGGELFVECAL